MVMLIIGTPNVFEKMSINPILLVGLNRYDCNV